MMDDEIRASRHLSYLLRHDPAAAGLHLDEGGWADVDVLLAAVARQGRPLDRAALDRLVVGTDKQRFERRANRIRATHGHSIDVDLDLHPAEPPAVLFHGTVARFLPAILTEGLTPQNRRYVHLSADVGGAQQVAARRGTPIVLSVDAPVMFAAGHRFHRTSSGIWLTDHVPTHWITPLDPTSHVPSTP